MDRICWSKKRPGNGSKFLGDFWERSEFEFWINSFVEKTLELEKQFHRYPDAPKENDKQNTAQGGSKQNIKHCCEWHKRQRSFSKTSITKNTTLGLIRLSMLKFRKAWTRLKSRNTNVVKSQLSRLCVRASISCHGCHVTQLLALPFAAFHPTALFVFLSSCTFLVCSPSLHQY